LVATSATAYNEPYFVARVLASLDHITGGRAGWNLVTGGNAEDASNFSVGTQYGFGFSNGGKLTPRLDWYYQSYRTNGTAALPQRDPDDRRAWRLVLTAKAEPILNRLRALAEEMSGEAFSGMSIEEVDAMRGKLARIRENVCRAEAAQKGVA